MCEEAKKNAEGNDRRDELVLQFHIDHPGEMDAGIWYYSDDVEIKVASGDAGGEQGEFAEFMRQALSEWYDGAGVELQDDSVTLGEQQEVSG
jgi:hypothetical protein